jgi:hypothetical protein
MEIREAILKAADQIEGNPALFSFMRGRPVDCRSPGCALGWVGFYASKSCFYDYRETAHMILKVPGHFGYGTGTSHYNFYDRMGALDDDWRHDAAACARALRLYADKYHPAQTPN